MDARSAAGDHFCYFDQGRTSWRSTRNTRNFTPSTCRAAGRRRPGIPPVSAEDLSGALDEKSKRGSRSRLLRFAPGVFTTKPFVHEYWEEVYLVSGDLTVGNDEQGKGGESFAPNTYASRPPGAWHGPFKSEKGCLLFEIHYFDPA